MGVLLLKGPYWLAYSWHSYRILRLGISLKNLRNSLPWRLYHLWPCLDGLALAADNSLAHISPPKALQLF